MAPRWDETLAAAVAAAPAGSGPGPILFLEERADCTIELRSDEGLPAVRETRLSGLAVSATSGAKIAIGPNPVINPGLGTISVTGSLIQATNNGQVSIKAK